MFNRGKLIVILIILILAAAVFLSWPRYNKWLRQEEAGVVSPIAVASPAVSATPFPVADDFRGRMMDAVAGEIGRLSPVQPVLGGQWYVNRFWFVNGGDDYFYVEYEDGHIMRQILAAVENQESGVDFKVEAYFEPGESGWILKSGQDSQFGQPLTLYEFDNILGKWVKKN